jgi:hypothetical protein
MAEPEPLGGFWTGVSTMLLAVGVPGLIALGPLRGCPATALRVARQRRANVPYRLGRASRLRFH